MARAPALRGGGSNGNRGPKSARVPSPALALGTALQLLPLVILFGGTVGVGIAVTVAQSLGSGAFVAALRDARLIAAALHSGRVALISATASTVLGTLLAYLLWRVPPPLRTVLAVYRIPIILPYIAVSYLVILIFSPTGWLAALLGGRESSATARVFGALLYGPGGWGMVAAYTFKGAPFVALMTFASFSRIPEQLLLTARMLGANEWTVLRRVALPHALPIVRQTFLILLFYAFGGFEVPYLLGSSNPEALPIIVYQRYFYGTPAQRATAVAALALLSTAAFLTVALYHRVMRVWVES